MKSKITVKIGSNKYSYSEKKSGLMGHETTKRVLAVLVNKALDVESKKEEMKTTRPTFPEDRKV